MTNEYQTLDHKNFKHQNHPQLIDWLRHKDLTPHERCVVLEVIKGQRHKITAQNLDIKEKAVKWHLTKIYRKLGVKSKSEMIVLCRDIIDRRIDNESQ